VQNRVDFYIGYRVDAIRDCEGFTLALLTFKTNKFDESEIPCLDGAPLGIFLWWLRAYS